MATQDRTGTVIDGRYQLEKLIGRGAMADVYRAHDTDERTAVAVKILRGQQARDPEAVARFQREAEVQGQIRHRNVAALYGGGTTDMAEPYLVVELLRGHSLRALLKQQGAVHPSRALSYTWQALQGLHAVHAQGILHRDLKPANLMLEPSPGVGRARGPDRLRLRRVRGRRQADPARPRRRQPDLPGARAPARQVGRASAATSTPWA